jgi:hypothetical protein
MLDIRQNEKVTNEDHHDKDGFKTMDFTHQNLYNADPFADFRTIVIEPKKDNEVASNNLLHPKLDGRRSTKEHIIKSDTIVNFFEDAADLSPSKAKNPPANEKPSP